MEKIAKYQSIIQAILKKYGAMRPNNDPIETQLVFDLVNHHYILMSVGWQGENFVYGSVFHIDIKPDGKVWVQQDNTDIVVVDKLLEGGIPSKDIVLGFQPPYIRPYMTEFAVE